MKNPSYGNIGYLGCLYSHSHKLINMRKIYESSVEVYWHIRQIKKCDKRIKILQNKKLSHEKILNELKITKRKNN